MHDLENAHMIESKRVPWNKGKMIGTRPPLGPKRVVYPNQVADRGTDPPLW